MARQSGTCSALLLALCFVALSAIVLAEGDNDMMRVLDAIQQVSDRIGRLEAKVESIREKHAQIPSAERLGEGDDSASPTPTPESSVLNAVQNAVSGGGNSSAQANSACTGSLGCPPFDCVAYPTSARFDPVTKTFRFADCGRTKQQGGDLDPSITCPDAALASQGWEPSLKVMKTQVEYFKDGCAACPKGWFISTHKGHQGAYEKIVCMQPPTQIQTECSPPYISSMDGITGPTTSAWQRTPISCTTTGPVATDQYFVVDPKPSADCTDCGAVYFFRHEITCMLVKRTLCATVTTKSSLEAYQSPSTTSVVSNTVGRNCASVKELTFNKLKITFARVRAAGATKAEENEFKEVSWDVTSISPKNAHVADIQARLANITELPSFAKEFYMNTVWPGFVNHDNNYGACSGPAQSS